MAIEMIEPEKAGMSSERLKRINPVMQSHIDKGVVAGLNVAIARKGKLVHFEQLGVMDKESQKPMAPDTIFRLYSMTKPVVSTALMMLYEQGHFHLIDPVSKFIPAFKNVKVLEVDSNGERKESALQRPITIRDLFTHTAGLTYDFLLNSPVAEMYQEAGLAHKSSRPLDALIDELARMPLAYQPGTRWHYSYGIDVLAQIIQVITNKPLGDFLADAIFKPLNMQDTGFRVPENKHQRVATMYGLPDITDPYMTVLKAFEAWQQGFNEKIDVSVSYPLDDPNWARGGSGLFSTTMDYLRFTQMLLNGGELDGVRLLSRKTLELMHSNHLPASLMPLELGGVYLSGYGFGLGSRVMVNVAESQKPGSVGEFGWSGAAKTYFWVDPVEELIGVFMTQYMLGIELIERDFQVLTYQAFND